MNRTSHTAVAAVILVMSSLLPAAAAPLTPVILFPGWGTTRLEVRVHNQSVAPDCPGSGTFEYTILAPATAFSQVCQNKLLTLVYHFDRRTPPGTARAPRVSEQRGVRVSVADYGTTESAPLYESLFAVLEHAGYQRNVNLRVAGYDFRLTPNMGGFMKRTRALIRKTYRDNPQHPGAPRGPRTGRSRAVPLTHTARRWRNKCIRLHAHRRQLAGQDRGTRCSSPVSTCPRSATRPTRVSAEQRSRCEPSATYMSASGLRTSETRRSSSDRAGGQGYPAGLPAAVRGRRVDAGAEDRALLLRRGKFRPPFFPDVDVYAEKGSGLATHVGIQLPDLTVGQVLGNAPVFITRDGDSNQEDITNDAVRVLHAMPCYHFELHDNPGVNHVALALGSPPVWQRLLMHLQQPKSRCPLE
jgi:lysophospholipase-3